jgi:hypothetical protein
MAVGGIGSGGAGSALLALRLALRQAQPGAGAPAGGAEAAAGAAAPTTPDAVLQDVVARAQFTASVRVAQTAVEQVDTVLQTYDAAAGAPA